jgi:hypothetical protein
MLIPLRLLPMPLAPPAGCQLALCDPLVDVRVAAWLGTPDDKRLKDEHSRSVNSGRNEPYTLSDMLKWVKPRAQPVLTWGDACT